MVVAELKRQLELESLCVDLEVCCVLRVEARQERGCKSRSEAKEVSAGRGRKLSCPS
jgi:hypothetical protein